VKYEKPLVGTVCHSRATVLCVMKNSVVPAATSWIPGTERALRSRASGTELHEAEGQSLFYDLVLRSARAACGGFIAKRSRSQARVNASWPGTGQFTRPSSEPGTTGCIF
jgi:hypothetical protein